MSEADFFSIIESEIKKISDFTQKEGRELLKQAEELADMAVEGTEDAETLKRNADALGSKFLRLEKFVNLNFLAFSKILKKHDKQLQTPARKYYMGKLLRKNWVKREFPQVFELLSKVYTILRGGRKRGWYFHESWQRVL